MLMGLVVHVVTLVLKKKVRQRIERNMDYSGQVFGFEYSKKEINRAIRFKEQYPELNLCSLNT